MCTVLIKLAIFSTYSQDNNSLENLSCLNCKSFTFVVLDKMVD